MKPLLLVGLVVAVAGCAAGPPTETMRKIDSGRSTLAPLTLGNAKGAQQIARAALLLDPKVREQAALTGASIDQIAIEQAAFRPSLGLGFVGGLGSAGKGKPAAQLSGEQLVLDFGGTKRAVDAADLDLQIQYLKFQKQVDSAVSQGILTYREVALMAEIVEIRQAQLAAMRKLHDQIALRVESGASPAPDLLETRNQLARVEYELLEARLQLAELRDTLARIAGRSEGGKIPTFGQNCAPPQGATDALKIARLEEIRSQLEVENAARARLPRISLNPLASAKVDGGGVSTGLNVNVDSALFQGGAIKARENAARNRRDSTQALVEAEERNLRLDDLRLRRQMASLREKQAMLTRQIEIQRETRDLYYSQYIELGTRQVTDLLDAEEAIYNRQVERAEANFDLQKALVECAARSKTLRADLGLTGAQLYGYPLTKDGF